MRVAIAISVWVAGFVLSLARANESFIQVDAGSLPGYIVPEKYAAASKADFAASIPGAEKIDGFWTPTETNVRMADRIFRETLDRAVKDPATLFPDLASDSGESSAADLQHERSELALVTQNFNSYGRQYVGVIIEGRKLIFCNYSDVKNVDYSMYYISMEKYFATDGSTHFLQCRFAVEDRTCENVSMIGSWMPKSAK